MHTVGIAGATGYSGQELVRLLARHPHVSLQTAMGSQKGAGGRTLPALSGLWNGEVEPYDFERLAANEVVFLALPEDARPTSRRSWSRVAGASSTCRAPFGFVATATGPAGITRSRRYPRARPTA